MSSRIAGGCTLVLLGTGAVVALSAIAPGAGILTLWGVGFGALWWAVSRPVRDTANPAPPPVPEGAEEEKPQFRIVPDPNHPTRHLVEWNTERETES